MKGRKDYFKALTGKDFKNAFRQRSYQESLDRISLRAKSKYQLRLLGRGDSEVVISEEDRDQNFHIIGAPKQGKSKFLEYNAIEDIKLGNGFCFIDASDGGDTMYNILNYCASSGHEKVCIIDPRTLHDYAKIAVFNPLNPARIEMSINGLMQSLAILFDTEMKTTSRIKYYLPALLSILVRTNNTLYETRYFRHFKENKHIREYIFDQLENNDRLDIEAKIDAQDDIHTLESVIYKEHLFNQFFASTVFRMSDIYREPLRYILSGNGIDFVKMVREGWVILVNLFPGKYMTEDVSQLLGIIIINQIIQAIDILFEAQPKRVKKMPGSGFYLYIDEAQSFATSQIATVLNNKRKSGLYTIFSHHYTSQFESKKVKDAIMKSAMVKVMFNVADGAEREMLMDALGYGGDITPKMASYANQNLPKQYAIIRKGKNPPVRIRIPDVYNPPVSQERLDTYMEKILSYDWYLTKEQINKQINARIIRANTAGSKSRKMDDRKATNKTDVPAGIQSREQQQSVSKGNEKPKNAPRQRKTLKI